MILHNGNRLGKNHFHGGKQTLFHSAIEGIKSDHLQLQENHYVHPGAEGVPSHLQTKGI